MAEGTSTYMGRGVGLRGNYEIQGDNDTDDTLTITGASSSAAGDILVLQNSTGTEFLAVSASGFVDINATYGINVAAASSFASTLTVTGALTASSTGVSVAAAGAISAVLPSSGWTGALQISVTTTGAITADTGKLANAIYVTQSSKSTLNSVIAFNSVITEADVVSAVSYLAVHGSKAPTYFLKVGNSTFGLGVGADNGFFDASLKIGATTSFSTLTTFCGIKIMAGTDSYVLLGLPASAVT